MHVSKIELANFRGFKSLSLALDTPVTVLVGKNGAGKTSLLHALAILLAPIGDYLLHLDQRPDQLPWSLPVTASDISNGWTTARLRIDAVLGETRKWGVDAQRRGPEVALAREFAQLDDHLKGLVDGLVGDPGKAFPLAV